MNEEFDQEFEDWFDGAITDNLFELTAPTAQYRSAKVAWEEATKRATIKKSNDCDLFLYT